MDARDVGRFVREQRVKRALSLGDLSQRSGVERGHLSVIENGKVLMQRSTAMKLERGLGLRDGMIWRAVLLARTPPEVQALILTDVVTRFLEATWL